jgi:hypothetical protein
VLDSGRGEAVRVGIQNRSRDRAVDPADEYLRHDSAVRVTTNPLI